MKILNTVKFVVIGLMYNSNFLLTFFVCSLLCLTHHEVQGANKPLETVKDKIDQINAEDRHSLELFFKALIVEGDFAFTLFADKPMSSTDHLIDVNSNLAAIEYLGWRVWTQYRHLFSFPTFCLVFENRTFGFGFRLVNKIKCLEVINRYPMEFKTCFQFQNPENLVKDICTPEFFLTTRKLKLSYLCLGLLFGYGEESARVFDRRMQLFQTLADCPLLDLETLNKDDRKYIYSWKTTKLEDDLPIFSVKEVIDELNDIKKHFTFSLLTTTENQISPIINVGFVTYQKEPELKVMQERYDEVYKKIIEIYYSENFLEIILTRLTK